VVLLASLAPSQGRSMAHGFEFASAQEMKRALRAEIAEALAVMRDEAIMEDSSRVSCLGLRFWGEN